MTICGKEIIFESQGYFKFEMVIEETGKITLTVKRSYGEEKFTGSLVELSNIPLNFEVAFKKCIERIFLNGEFDELMKYLPEELRSKAISSLDDFVNRLQSELDYIKENEKTLDKRIDLTNKILQLQKEIGNQQNCINGLDNEGKQK